MGQLTFLSEAPPANLSRSQDLEAGWAMTVATSRLSILGLLTANGPDGWFGRMSPASCPQTEEGTLVPYSGAWQNSGMGSPTQFWTHSTLEFRSGAVASSLSDILETGDVPQRYYLSATACKGILRRAAKRGKALPGALLAALQSVVGMESPKPN